jgi:hypothetical protein
VCALLGGRRSRGEVASEDWQRPTFRQSVDRAQAQAQGAQRYCGQANKMTYCAGRDHGALRFTSSQFNSLRLNTQWLGAGAGIVFVHGFYLRSPPTRRCCFCKAKTWVPFKGSTMHVREYCLLGLIRTTMTHGNRNRALGYSITRRQPPNDFAHLQHWPLHAPVAVIDNWKLLLKLAAFHPPFPGFPPPHKGPSPNFDHTIAMSQVMPAPAFHRVACCTKEP